MNEPVNEPVTEPAAEPAAEPDAIAEVAGTEILPVPEPSTGVDSTDAAAAAEPREFEFPERLLVDDLDEIEQWAEENGVPLQPRARRSVIGWLRLAIIAFTMIVLAIYAVAALT